MYKILIIDDDRGFLKSLHSLLSYKNYDVEIKSDPVEAQRMLQENSYDCMLLDVNMPRLSGLDLLDSLGTLNSNTPVIMISGQGTVPLAVEAIKHGAYDFLEKPLDAEKLLLTIKNAIDKKIWGKEKKELIAQLDPSSRMVGESKKLKNVISQINSCAPTDAKVLILGESGVGKELVARALHYNSKRNSRRFVKVNCAAIPGELLENELFGHKKGSYTGAEKDYEGKIFLANTGTLFLDEIGDLDLRLQAKLLHVLQDYEFDPVGSNKPVKVDIRVISASNKNLEKMVEDGSFRKDLLHRINTIKITVPSLRDRPEDIPILARFFLRQFAETYNKRLVDFSPMAMNLLCAYKWPGNIRELKNIVENISVFTQNVIIAPQDIHHAMGVTDTLPGKIKLSTNIAAARDEFEREFILHQLNNNEWKMGVTAQAIGIDRSALFKKIKKLGISKEADKNNDPIT